MTIAADGAPGYLGLKTKTRVVSLVSGCHFRPFNTMETPVTETDVATEVWKLTAPPTAAVLAAKSTGELLFDGTDNPADTVGNRFQITGPVQPKYDGGRVHHVTVMCQRQVG